MVDRPDTQDELSPETQDMVMALLGSGAMIVGSLIMIGLGVIGLLLWWLL